MTDAFRDTKAYRDLLDKYPDQKLSLDVLFRNHPDQVGGDGQIPYNLEILLEDKADNSYLLKHYLENILAMPKVVLKRVLGLSFAGDDEFQTVANVISAATPQVWQTIPEKFHLMIFESPDLLKLLHITKDFPEKTWGRVNHEYVPVILRHPKFYFFLTLPDSFEKELKELSKLFNKAREIYDRNQFKEEEISFNEFLRIVGPMLLSQNQDGVVEHDRIFDYVRRIKEALADESDPDLPMIGYEVEIPNYVDNTPAKRDYNNLRSMSDLQLDREHGKYIELVSRPFKNAKLASLSLESLVESGFIPKSGLKEGKTTMHLNLEIPSEELFDVLERAQYGLKTRSRDVLDSSSSEYEEIMKLQNIFLKDRVSSRKRLDDDEWDAPFFVKGADEIEGSGAGRIELRVFEVHSKAVLEAIEKLPQKVQTMYAHLARKNDFEYPEDQESRDELAEKWQKETRNVPIETDRILQDEIQFRKGPSDEFREAQYRLPPKPNR